LVSPENYQTCGRRFHIILILLSKFEYKYLLQIFRENTLNKHADFWVDITNAGETSGQTKRIKGNIKTKDNQIPVLSGTSKDHKKVKDAKIVPDVRPIMGAMVGPNVGLANFASMIVRTIADDMDEGHVSKSTEETICKLENYNAKIENLNGNDVGKNSKVIIGSMDIDKWYPSQIPGPSAKGVKDMFEESRVEFEGINYDKVSRYLGEFLSEEEIKQEGIEEIVYMKIKKVKKVKQKIAKAIGKKQARKPVANANRKQKGKGKILNTKTGGDNTDKEIQALKTAPNVNMEQKGKGKTLNTKAGGGKADKEVKALKTATIVNGKQNENGRTLNTKAGGGNTDKEVKILTTAENVNREQKEKRKTLNTKAGEGNSDKEVEALKTATIVNREQNRRGNTLNTKANQEIPNKTDWGDVTSANSDEQCIQAHKQGEIVNGKIESNGNIINNDLGNVTSVSKDGKPKTTRKERFTAPKRKPTKTEERKLLGKAIELMIKTGMENHIYRFHNKLRIQKTGGPMA
jgi:hypothetical protein